MTSHRESFKTATDAEIETVATGMSPRALMQAINEKTHVLKILKRLRRHRHGERKDRQVTRRLQRIVGANL